MYYSTCFIYAIIRAPEDKIYPLFLAPFSRLSLLTLPPSLVPRHSEKFFLFVRAEEGELIENAAGVPAPFAKQRVFTWTNVSIKGCTSIITITKLLGYTDRRIVIN